MAARERGRVRRLSEYLLSYGEYPGESEARRGGRRILVGAFWFSLPFIALGGVSDLADGFGWLALSSFGQATVHLGGLVLIGWRPLLFVFIINSIFFLDVMHELVDTAILGGLLPSGVTVVWALVAVLGALVALRLRAATVWFIVFCLAVIAATALPNFFDPIYTIPDPEINAAFNIIGATVLVFLVMAYFVHQRDRFQGQSDDLLHNILPDEIVGRLKASDSLIADHFESASVLFADVVDFTPMSADLSPSQLVGLLDEVFTTLDGFVDESELEKIKTVGDEYMVAAGVPGPRPDHAHAIADLALRIRDHVAANRFRGHQITLRIGINSGPVVAGVIGTNKFAYDLWGDTVNTASRMESEGLAGSVQLTAATYELIRDEFVCEPRGAVAVKGKGSMDTYLLVSRRDRQGEP